ncbi:hypothetical protein BJ912DRAFT_1145337 [Pholiota molesta]|nr:hypothetical protein BJ912DRAFT_1145337 [Pholiota molesta]
MCDNVFAPCARSVVERLEPIAVSVPHTPFPSYHQTGTSATVRQLPAARKAKPHRRTAEAGCDVPPPRPSNPFFVFRSAFHRYNPGGAKGKQTDLSKQASQAWKQLTDAEKTTFRVIAQELKRKHELKYPGYKYAPLRASSEKSSQTKGKKAAARKARASSATSSRARRALPTVEVAWSPTPSSSSASPLSASHGSYSPEHIPSRDATPRAAAHVAVPSHGVIDWVPSPSSSSPSTSYPVTPQTSPQQPSSSPLFPELGSMREFSVLELNPFTEEFQIVQQPYSRRSCVLPRSTAIAASK